MKFRGLKVISRLRKDRELEVARRNHCQGNAKPKRIASTIKKIARTLAGILISVLAVLHIEVKLSVPLPELAIPNARA